VKIAPNGVCIGSLAMNATKIEMMMKKVMISMMTTMVCEKMMQVKMAVVVMLYD
jgi:hypothetical protein